MKTITEEGDVIQQELDALINYSELAYKVATPLCENIKQLSASMMTCKTPEMKSTLKKICYGIIDSFSEIQLEPYNLK